MTDMVEVTEDMLDIPEENFPAIIEDLENQIKVSNEERDKRMSYEKDYILKTMDSACGSFLTANGYMHCMETLKDIIGRNPAKGLVIKTAKDMYFIMSQVFSTIDDRLKDDEVDYDSLYAVFDTYIDDKFMCQDEALISPFSVAKQLLIFELRNGFTTFVDRMKAFDNGSKEGIKNLEEELEKYKNANSNL